MRLDERADAALQTLRQELDVRPVPDVSVVLGRARRRRTTVGVVAVALALVVATTAAALGLTRSGDGPRVQTPPAASTATGNTPIATDSIALGPIPSFAGEDSSFEQSVARLEAWYRNARADAPGGRPMLDAERMICDLRAVPAGHSETQYSFASYFPLSESLTETRLAEGCLQTDWIRQADLGAQLIADGYVLCATNSPRLLQQLPPSSEGVGSSGPRPAPPLRPVIAFGSTSCADNAYERAPAHLLDDWNARRRIEIQMRAVPRDCPTPEEAVGWVRKVATETGTSFEITVSAPNTANPPTTGGPTTDEPSTDTTWCYRDIRPNWDSNDMTIAPGAVSS